MLEQLASAALDWGFPVLVVALVASGLGLPLPENIPLLLIGFLCERREIPVGTWAGLCLGIILSRDALIYALGRHMPTVVTSSRLYERLFPERRQAQVRAHFDRSGFATVFAGRFAPGLRLVIFLVAGQSGLPARSFLLADGLAAILSVPVLVALGYLFSHQLSSVKRHVDVVQAVIAAAVLAYFAWVIVRAVRRARRRDAD